MSALSDRGISLRILAAVLILLVACSAGVVGSQTASVSQQTTLTVGPSEEAQYNEIQPAVAAASPGTTISVESAVYERPVVINKSVVIVAPNGATLRASESGQIGVTISNSSEVSPKIKNIKITGFQTGIQAERTTGDWTLRNVTVTNSREDGIAADETSGRWSILDSDIHHNGDEGIDAERTTVPWRINRTTIHNNSDDGIDADGEAATSAWLVANSILKDNDGQGIDAENSSGDWEVRSTAVIRNQHGIQSVNTRGNWTIRRSSIGANQQIGVNTLGSSGNWSIKQSVLSRNQIAAVLAERNTGSWVIQNSTIENTSVGVYATLSSGSWEVEHTEFHNITTIRFDFAGEGTAIYATDTNGSWSVRNSSFEHVDVVSINATGAKAGMVQKNWWNSVETRCVGTVSCKLSLENPPAKAGADYRIGKTDVQRPTSTGIGLLNSDSPIGLLIIAAVVILATSALLAKRIL